MKTPTYMLWLASAFLIAVYPSAHGESDAVKRPNPEAQAILDSINNDRTSMYTADGELDPQEVEHLHRMIKLYEMKAGFVDVEKARAELGLPSRTATTALAQNDGAQSGEIQQLRLEVVDLHQRIADLEQQNQYVHQGGAAIQEAAGAAAPLQAPYPQPQHAVRP
jgi:hypothetical protein